MLSVAVDMINGIHGLLRMKGQRQGKEKKKTKNWTNNNISYVFGPVTSRKENCESVRRSFRPAGSLTYCVCVGGEDF